MIYGQKLLTDGDNEHRMDRPPAGISVTHCSIFCLLPWKRDLGRGKAPFAHSPAVTYGMERNGKSLGHLTQLQALPLHSYCRNNPVLAGNQDRI